MTENGKAILLDTARLENHGLVVTGLLELNNECICFQLCFRLQCREGFKVPAYAMQDGTFCVAFEQLSGEQ